MRMDFRCAEPSAQHLTGGWAEYVAISPIQCEPLMLVTLPHSEDVVINKYRDEVGGERKVMPVRAIL